MHYIMQITDKYREMYDNITGFRFVIYSFDRKMGVQKFFWVRPSDLPEKIGWLHDKLIDIADELDIDPSELSIGLANTVATSEGRRYIPMIDFEACFGNQHGWEHIKAALEMLNIGHGAIVLSSVMNFGVVAFHFFGFNLWDKAKWCQFVEDGMFDKYGFDEEANLPMYPQWPYYSADAVGESWCRLVRKQNNTAFLRVLPRRGASTPAIVELFDGATLTERPPENAPCMSPYTDAQKQWLAGTTEENRRFVELMGDLYRIRSSPAIADFCVSDCPLDGCSMECPKTAERLGYKRDHQE